MGKFREDQAWFQMSAAPAANSEEICIRKLAEEDRTLLWQKLLPH